AFAAMHPSAPAIRRGAPLALELLVRQDAGDRRSGAVGSELAAAEIPAVGHAVAILVDRRLALERTWILAVVQTVAVGVVAARVDARIGRIVRTRVVAVERAVAVRIGARRIAPAPVLAVHDAVLVRVDRRAIAAESARHARYHAA